MTDADHAQDLAAIDVQVDMVVQQLVAEAVDQAPDLDDGFLFAPARHVQIPMIENMMENPASSTITRKMDSTTERVVSLTTLAALLSTCRPS